MTDRELLELAAKAAGLEIDKSPYNGGGSGNTGFDCMGNAVLDWHNGVRWNPLADDGDALRLAVKLRIQITPGTYNEYEATAFRAGAAEAHEKTTMGYGTEAATRRAIVRAAAEIGKSMK